MKTKRPNFVANPGLGWLFRGNTTPQGNVFWEGSMTTFATHDTGEFKRVQLQATGFKEPKDATKAQKSAHLKAGGDRYEFKVVEIGKDDEPWKHLGSFTMPAFGSRRSQVVDTPIGKLTSWLQAPRNNQGWCIRFRMLRDNNGVVRQERPM